jgi:hypothetical protein
VTPLRTSGTTCPSKWVKVRVKPSRAYPEKKKKMEKTIEEGGGE